MIKSIEKVTETKYFNNYKMEKLSKYIFNRFIKDTPIEARLIKRGLKPHYSNIKHLILGTVIAIIAGAITFGVCVWVFEIRILWVFAASCAAALIASGAAGYLKEAYDKSKGKPFDKLDLYATALGGLFYYILALLIFITYLLILIN